MVLYGGGKTSSLNPKGDPEYQFRLTFVLLNSRIRTQCNPLVSPPPTHQLTLPNPHARHPRRPRPVHLHAREPDAVPLHDGVS
jgi:hypothetical protein